MKHLLIVLVLLFLSIPVLAQHRGTEQRSGQHVQRSAPQRGNVQRGGQRQVGPGNREVRPPQGNRSEQRRPEYQGRREYRGHEMERRGFHDRYVGHNFYWGSCRWRGTRFLMGSRFWYGSLWFEIVEVVPVGWSPYDEVIIIEDGEDYFLYNPRFHARVSVIIAF